MSRVLTPETIATVKATVPAIEAHGLDIVRIMYERMFQNEAIRDLFNQSHHGDAGSQPRALATAILAYASNIENLGALAPAVERIAQKHVGLQILPEHYPYVAEALLGAIREVLGEAATEEVLAAWGEAYWFLADILIARENHIYRDQEAAPGGWTGWRDFVIEEVREESAIIRSFVLRPTDGGRVMDHRPGQYLTFWFDIPGNAPLKRNYSISSAPNGKTYRISVKREPQGVVSGWLHAQKPGTVLKVSPPAGEFFLPERPERPVVLLSGGVGLTPMVAMLEALVERHPDVPVLYAHGTHDSTHHAMRDHIKALAGQRPNTKVTTFYETPLAGDRQGTEFDHKGVIDEAWLRAETPIDDADYFICGPRPMLRTLVTALSMCGLPSNRIHYEFFGPADELLAA